MIFRNMQKEVESRIGTFIEHARRCMDLTQASIESYCKSGDRNSLKEEYAQIHSAESAADDMKAEISCMLFSESLFPESRGVILELLDKMDGLPNHAESTARMMLHQHVTIPEKYASGIIDLLNVSCRASRTLFESAIQLFSNFTSATEGIEKVDQLESEADSLETGLIERIFSDSMGGFEKLLLRDFVQHISQIADRAEVVGSLIRLIVARRSI